ncbi:MAG: hypothetical protein ACI9PU_001504, partial [Ascidiaceihabitans sp.]
GERDLALAECTADISIYRHTRRRIVSVAMAIGYCAKVLDARVDPHQFRVWSSDLNLRQVFHDLPGFK